MLNLRLSLRGPALSLPTWRRASLPEDFLRGRLAPAVEAKPRENKTKSLRPIPGLHSLPPAVLQTLTAVDVKSMRAAQLSGIRQPWTVIPHVVASLHRSTSHATRPIGKRLRQADRTEAKSAVEPVVGPTKRQRRFSGRKSEKGNAHRAAATAAATDTEEAHRKLKRKRKLRRRRTQKRGRRAAKLKSGRKEAARTRVPAKGDATICPPKRGRPPKSVTAAFTPTPRLQPITTRRRPGRPSKTK
jgi:hypothetical protein